VRFELLHIAMLPRPQGELFGPRTASGAPPSREDWLREVFAAEQKFAHHGIDFHFVPESLEGPLIGGRIGRRIRVVENEPPESGLHETERETWRAAAIVIDPTHHETGQRLAVEILTQVGRPGALLDSLCNSINARVPPEPYLIGAIEISDARSFWDFETAHRGQITVLTFEFVAPNMFSIKDDLNEGLRDMRDHERMQKAKFQISNPDGLELDRKRIEAGVDLASKGGATLKAKTKTGGRFNSRDRSKKVTIPEQKGEIPEELSLKTRIARAMNAVFGE
jgi:hypothetical protein